MSSTATATTATTEKTQCEHCGLHDAVHTIRYDDGEDTNTDQVCHLCYWHYRLEQRIDFLAARVEELENKRT